MWKNESYPFLITVDTPRTVSNTVVLRRKSISTVAFPLHSQLPIDRTTRQSPFQRVHTRLRYLRILQLDPPKT